VFCSNRGQRGGCGRTFALFLAEVLPRHSVTATLLWQVLVGWLAGAAVQTAVTSLHAQFSLESFYRLVRRVRARLDVLRVALSRERPAPASAHADALGQTVAHLAAVFPSPASPLAAWQHHFQRPLLG
jgi:hypothetical protein